MDAFFTWIEPRWFHVVIILVTAWLGRHFGGIIIDRLVRRAIRSTKFNPMSADDIKKRQDTLSSLFTVILKAIIVLIASVMLFETLFPEINLTPFLASAGILGVAIGFGAQSLIKDFLTGIFIISENQYRVGDVIDLQGATGTVERITIRSTILRDADGNVHYIPNGSVVHVINKTMGFSKVNFTIAVDPATNVHELAEIINTVGKKLANDDVWKDKITEAPHFLDIGTFSESKLEVAIVGTTQPSAQWSVTGELRQRLLRAFKHHKIDLA